MILKFKGNRSKSKLYEHWLNTVYSSTLWFFLSHPLSTSSLEGYFQSCFFSSLLGKVFLLYNHCYKNDIQAEFDQRGRIHRPQRKSAHRIVGWVEFLFTLIVDLVLVERILTGKTKLMATLRICWPVSYRMVSWVIYQGSCLGKSLDKKMFGLYGAKTEGVHSLWLVKRSANKCFGPYFCLREAYDWSRFSINSAAKLFVFSILWTKDFFQRKHWKVELCATLQAANNFLYSKATKFSRVSKTGNEGVDPSWTG